MVQAHDHGNTERNVGSFYYVFEIGPNGSPGRTQPSSRDFSSHPGYLFDRFSYVMVMPYYPCSSAAWFNIRIQKGEWKEFVRGLTEVTRGVQQLHAIGILHGDIKPDNILFDSEDGNQGTAKIIDFGESVAVAVAVRLTG
jgi:serine/threonine protein kinase